MNSNQDEFIRKTQDQMRGQHGEEKDPKTGADQETELELQKTPSIESPARLPREIMSSGVKISEEGQVAIKHEDVAAQKNAKENGFHEETGRFLTPSYNKKPLGDESHTKKSKQLRTSKTIEEKDFSQKPNTLLTKNTGLGVIPPSSGSFESESIGATPSVQILKRVPSKGNMKKANAIATSKVHSSMVCDEADCSPYSVPSANIGGVSTYHYPEECSNLVENLADDISLNGLANHQPGGGEDDEKSLESCCNGRFIKHEDLISTSKYRTIFRGYDNESGCEIAWNVYSLENVESCDRERIVSILDTVKQLKHQNILTCIHYIVKEKELVMITELITAGSIREYLKKIKLPRLVVIKNWCKKILEGVGYLHSQNFIHGKLTCESIYINSNNGDIKIGDIGIRSIPCYNNKYSELSQCNMLKNSEETLNLDIFCFGLSLLEMISSDVSGTQAFKVLCKIINKGQKQQILGSIIDEKLRDIIGTALEEVPDKRATITDLLSMPFLQRSDNDNNPVQLSNQLAQLIKKYSNSIRRNNAPHRVHSGVTHNNSSVLDSMTSSTIIDSSSAINKSKMKLSKKLAKIQTDNPQTLADTTHKSQAKQIVHDEKEYKRSSSTFLKRQKEEKKKTQVTLEVEEEKVPTAIKREADAQTQSIITSQKDMNTQQVQNQPIYPLQQSIQPARIPQSPSIGQQQPAQRLVLIKISVMNLPKSILYVSFQYNLDLDTTEGVVNEMKHELNLVDPAQIESLKAQLDQIICQVTRKMSSVSEISQPASQPSVSASNSNPQIEEVKPQQPVQPDTVRNDLVSTQIPLLKKKIQNKLNRDEDIDQDEGNPTQQKEEEEAVIIEDRGGAQEHHNQTMDEVYHQNINDDDVQIKFNMVSNPNNILNSMILHDKNDLNDPSPSDDALKQEVSNKVNQASKAELFKKEMTDFKRQTAFMSNNQYNQQQQILQPQEEMDESSDSGEELAHNRFNDDNSNQDLQWILEEAFPNYQQIYWDTQNSQQVAPPSNEKQILHKTSNLLHQTPGGVNDTLDLSHCSFTVGNNLYYVGQHSSTISADHSNNNASNPVITPQLAYHSSSKDVAPLAPQKREIAPPFILEDVSAIIGKHTAKVSSEETKIDNNQEHHDHQQDFFMEGMSSLFCEVDKQQLANLTTIQSYVQIGPSMFQFALAPQSSAGNQIAHQGITSSKGGHNQMSVQSLSSDSHSRKGIKNSLAKIQYKISSAAPGQMVQPTDSEIGDINFQINMRPNSQLNLDILQMKVNEKISPKDSDIQFPDNLLSTDMNQIAHHSEGRESENAQTPQFMASKAGSIHYISQGDQNIPNQRVQPFLTSSSGNVGSNSASPPLQYSSSISAIQGGVPVSQDQQAIYQSQQTYDENMNSKHQFRGINVYPMHRHADGQKLPLIPQMVKNKSVYDGRANHSTNIVLVKPPPKGSQASTVTKQKSVIIQCDPRQKPIINKKGTREELGGTNNCPKKLEIESQLISQQIESHLKENEYFQFEQDQMVQQCSYPLNEQCPFNLIFESPMQSIRLQRKYKQMYKNDINALQMAFRRIFNQDLTSSRGHFCKHTERCVKEFQKLTSLTPDGVVDAPLWREIMNRALSTSCNKSHEENRLISYSSNISESSENHRAQGATYTHKNRFDDHSSSTFDLQMSSAQSLASPSYGLSAGDSRLIIQTPALHRLKSNSDCSNKSNNGLSNEIEPVVQLIQEPSDHHHHHTIEKVSHDINLDNEEIRIIEPIGHSISGKQEQIQSSKPARAI